MSPLRDSPTNGFRVMPTIDEKSAFFGNALLIIELDYLVQGLKSRAFGIQKPQLIGLHLGNGCIPRSHNVQVFTPVQIVHNLNNVANTKIRLNT